MKTIYKNELQLLDEQIITIPFGAEILTVQTQRETPCLWFLVDPNEGRLQEIKIAIHGTGHIIHEPRFKKYLGTFQLQGGSFVGHAFEII
jgi:hypothetical protein